MLHLAIISGQDVNEKGESGVRGARMGGTHRSRPHCSGIHLHWDPKFTDVLRTVSDLVVVDAARSVQDEGTSIKPSCHVDEQKDAKRCTYTSIDVPGTCSNSAQVVVKSRSSCEMKGCGALTSSHSSDNSSAAESPA